MAGRGIGLKAGEIVTTGSCSAVIPVAAGDTASGDFGALGVVAVRFIAA